MLHSAFIHLKEFAANIGMKDLKHLFMQLDAVPGLWNMTMIEQGQREAVRIYCQSMDSVSYGALWNSLETHVEEAITVT